MLLRGRRAPGRSPGRNAIECRSAATSMGAVQCSMFDGLYPHAAWLRSRLWPRVAMQQHENDGSKMLLKCSHFARGPWTLRG